MKEELIVKATIVGRNSEGHFCTTEWENGWASDEEVLAAFVSILEDIFRDKRYTRLLVNAYKVIEAMRKAGVNSYIEKETE